MIKKYLILLSGFLLLTAYSYGGKVHCPNVAVILKGTIPGPMHGSSYHEHLEMHKISGGPGYNGKWKVDLLRQINIYPYNLRVHHKENKKIKFQKNMWMQCKSTMSGNRFVSDCTGGNLIFDVYSNRIGSHRTNIWIGKIKGDHVSLKFDKNNHYEPTLTGTIKKVAGGKLDLNIISPSEKEKFVYSSDTPGTFELELKARVTPKSYEADIVWEIPDIGNSKKIVDPPSSKGPTVHVQYTGLPKYNANFGEKYIEATVDTGLCNAQDRKKVLVFFPRDAKNNPTQKEPNWFYYWSQTSARVGSARFGDPAHKCGTSQTTSADDILGYYRFEQFDSVYYICNLQGLGESFPFKTVQHDGNAFKLVPVTGIDTFAAASHHENGHYRHFHEWWLPYKVSNCPPSHVGDMDRDCIKDAIQTAKDSDNDQVPDTKEAAFGLDPTKKYTYPTSENFDDEEIATWYEEAKWQIGSANKEDWAKPGKQWP
ncbi:MAG: hypothetical protein P794_08250 [Epsilonproteobacteria bacterium (ex Lamellibrachia satsuma)]|nr:MAG: hypothetical protein P794_08250 [Epsilonproteobacteria bacterium (ex Lamellibrachia satsuma)]